MSYAILKEIKQAEVQAEETRKAAIAKARQIADDAQAECYRLVSEARQAGEQEAKALLAGADQAVRDEVEQIKARAEKERAALAEMTRPKMESTVAAIMERIVGS